MCIVFNLNILANDLSAPEVIHFLSFYFFSMLLMIREILTMYLLILFTRLDHLFCREPIPYLITLDIPSLFSLLYYSFRPVWEAKLYSLFIMWGCTWILLWCFHSHSLFLTMPKIWFDTQFSVGNHESIIKAVFCKNDKISSLQQTISPGHTTLYKELKHFSLFPDGPLWKGLTLLGWPCRSLTPPASFATHYSLPIRC